MSAPAQPSSDPVHSKEQLIAVLESGCKPADAWRIGTEHEKFCFRRADLRPLDYDGPAGVEALLQGLQAEGNWSPYQENGKLIALTRDGANITLEPGGQLELSGAPLQTLHETDAETRSHLDECRTVGDRLDVGFLALGFNPKWSRADTPWMPKGRYAVMRRYMPLRGSLGLDMMLRTCTVQVNLDFASEADMIKKFRVSLALQPVATALFANSPFTEGRPNGFLSYRSHIWTDTDADRCGTIPFVFEDGMSFERYVDYVLDVPMYFVYRDGQYCDVAGQSFRDFMQGRLPGLPGQIPTIGDWNDHLTTVFPEVRLKRYLEMRGADSGPADRLTALSAFWVGLLYDDSALNAAWDLVKDWTAEDHAALRATVPGLGLQAPLRGRPLAETARQALAISRAGLAARACLSAAGADETGYLDPLDRIAATGRTAAEDLLDAVAQAGGSVDRLYEICAY